MAQIRNSLSKFNQCVKILINSHQKFDSIISKNRSLKKNSVKKHYEKTKLLLSASPLFKLIGNEKKELDTAEEVVHRVALATIALKDGNIEKSGNMLFDILDFAEANNFPIGVISACDMLSSLAMKIGDYDKAEILLLKALDNLRRQGAPEDDSYVVSFNLKLSRLYSTNGNDNLAEAGFKNCIKLQKNKINKDKDDEAVLLWSTILFWYGKFLLKKKRYKEAKSCFKDCLETSLDLESLSPNQVMVILYNIGEICEILGEHDEAIEHFLKGVSLDKEEKNPDLAYFYKKLGTVSMHKGLYEEAKQWCDQAQKSAIRYRNSDAKRESKECLEKLKTILAS